MVSSLVLRATLARWLVQLRESRLGGPVAAALLLPGSLTPLLVLVALVRPAGGGERPQAAVAAPLVEAARPDAGAPREPAPVPMPATAPLARADLSRTSPPREHRDGPCPVLIAHGELPVPDEPPSHEPSHEPSEGRVEATAVDEALGQLWAALEEARGNVEKARALSTGARPDGWSVGRLFTGELREAVLGNPWVTASDAGEGESLLREARWLAELDPTGPEPAGRSWEDLRFLTEGIAWYLGCAYERARRELGQRRQRGFVDAVAEPAPVGPPPPVVEDGPPLDRARLREFRALEGFEDLLAEWD